MRPILGIDKVVLVGFSAILILIGVLPVVIAPIVEAGVLPVVERVQGAQQMFTVMDSVQMVATNLFHLLGGA
jgi:hypothetical protein